MWAGFSMFSQRGGMVKVQDDTKNGIKAPSITLLRP